MISRFRTAALSALIGLGAIAAIPASAQAEGLYLNYGGSHAGVGVGMQFGSHDRVDYRHGPRYDRRDYRRCTPHRAVDKARRYGVQRARVVDVGSRTIRVAGRKWGKRIHMTFGKAPSCPIIRR